MDTPAPDTAPCPAPRRRVREALCFSLTLFLVALVAATSGRALGREPADHLHRRRRLNEDEDDDRRHSREAHLLAIVLGVLFFATIMCVVACLVHCTISLIACLMPNGQLARASLEMSLSKVHPRAPDEDQHL